MHTRFGRVLAVVYLAGIPLAWGGFVAFCFSGAGWALATFLVGDTFLAATAFDLRLRDPSIIEREQSRRWPMSSSWPFPAGWRTAMGQVMVGQQVPTAWSVLRGAYVRRSDPGLR